MLLSKCIMQRGLEEGNAEGSAQGANQCSVSKARQTPSGSTLHNDGPPVFTDDA